MVVTVKDCPPSTTDASTTTSDPKDVSYPTTVAVKDPASVSYSTPFTITITAHLPAHLDPSHGPHPSPGVPTPPTHRQAHWWTTPPGRPYTRQSHQEEPAVPLAGQPPHWGPPGDPSG